MLSANEFLDVLIAACGRSSPEQIARASVVGKNEAMFRDLTLNELSRIRPEWLCRGEWDTPKDAFDRWSRVWPAETKSKGIVDLVAVSAKEPFSESPKLAAEFKLWYWFDALDDSKYGDSKREYHHKVSDSFVMDATKLVSVMPDAELGRMIVTVVPTFHLDEIPLNDGNKRGDFLINCGFPKSYVSLTKADVKAGVPSTSETRSRALGKISDYFRGTGCPTVVGGQITGEFRGLRVTTDFVVSEIPRELTRR